MKAARTILIVDDSARMRDAIVRCCTGSDDTVIEASNGREAVECFLRHQPDWTIMDVQMPQMNGLNATRCIHSENPQARVIILSQHDSPDLREAAREAGAMAYLKKDRLNDLPVILSSLLQNSSPNPKPGSSS